MLLVKEQSIIDIRKSPFPPRSADKWNLVYGGRDTLIKKKLEISHNASLFICLPYLVSWFGSNFNNRCIYISLALFLTSLARSSFLPLFLNALPNRYKHIFTLHSSLSLVTFTSHLISSVLTFSLPLLFVFPSNPRFH